MLPGAGLTPSPTASWLPTFAEQGLPGCEACTWTGLFAQAKLPPEVVARLNAALNKALASPPSRPGWLAAAAKRWGPARPSRPMPLPGVSGRDGWVSSGQ